MLRRVAVVGTGLIGGSLGLGLRAAAPGIEVVGYDEDPLARTGAVERGAVSASAGSAAEAVSGADAVFLCLPVDRIPSVCWAIGHAVSAECVVSDVGSAKEHVVVEGEAVFGGRFVGGHPMAGSERHGIDAADAGLFEGAWWVLTPTAETSSEAYSSVADVAKAVGATPVAVDPSIHDALVARLSHLPQLTASALVSLAVSAGDRDALLGLAAGGFRDVTRIAASDPDLWVAIIRANRRAVLEALDGFSGRLQELAGMISRDRWQELRAFLSSARSARLELFAKPEMAAARERAEEPIALSVMVPDRPGVLAEVTTAAGQLGVNIEDLRIVHSTEGGRGRLELIVADAPSAEALVGALTALGYRVERTYLE